MEPGAEETLRRILAGSRRGEESGNARFARTLFEQALNAQALRLGQGDVDTLTHAELAVLTPGDLLAGARALGEEPLPPRPERGSWFGRKPR